MMSKKISHDDEHLDFGKVEKEVENAVLSDEMYWLQNDAKIRAVEQRVGTYDEFKEMVAAAHLRPLEKEDRISSMGTFTQVWNQAALKYHKGSVDGEKKNPGDSEQQPEMKIPKSGQEFVQQWKRYCKTVEEKKHVLFTIGAKRISELFKTEISGGLLGEFLECLQHFETDEELIVVELLEAFSNSQRFSLTLAFLSKSEKGVMKQLFEKLTSLTSVKNSEALTQQVKELSSKYMG